jgi:hypothetical protein
LHAFLKMRCLWWVCELDHKLASLAHPTQLTFPLPARWCSLSPPRWRSIDIK